MSIVNIVSPLAMVQISHYRAVFGLLCTMDLIYQSFSKIVYKICVCISQTGQRLSTRFTKISETAHLHLMTPTKLQKLLMYRTLEKNKMTTNGERKGG